MNDRTLGGRNAARGKEGSMGKQLDYDTLIDHLRRMMEARQIDRLPKSGYTKAIEDVAGCPTVDAPTKFEIKHAISNTNIPKGMNELDYLELMSNIYTALAKLYGEEPTIYVQSGRDDDAED